MRALDVKCDNCGAAKPARGGADPAKTWWVLEDYGARQRTGAMDFCSLPCLRAWVDDPVVRELLALDFVAPARRTGAVNWPQRWRVMHWCWRRRILRWVVQVLVVRA